MSFINFIGQGLKSVDSKYLNPGKPEFGFAETPTYIYAGKITTPSRRSTNASLVRYLDDTVKITTVSNKVRHEAQVLWSKYRNYSAITGTVFTLTALGTGGLVAAEILALPYLAATVVTALVAGYFFYRAYQSHEMLNKWEDPMPKFVAQRQNCEPGNIKNGFMHVKRNDLKGTIVHPNEVKDIWFGTVEKLRSNHSQARDDAKAEYINDFFTAENPFAPASLKYAFGDETTFSNPKPDVFQSPKNASDIQKIATQYETYFTQFTAIKTDFANKQAAVTQKETAAKSENEKHRSLDLGLAKIARDFFVNPIEKLREAALKPHKEALETKKRQIERQYEKATNPNDLSAKRGALQNAEDEYKSLAKPINESFDAQRKPYDVIFGFACRLINEKYDKIKSEIEAEANAKREKLKSQENSQLSQLLPAVTALYTSFDQPLVPAMYPDLNAQYSGFEYTVPPRPAFNTYFAGEMNYTDFNQSQLNEFLQKASAPSLNE